MIFWGFETLDHDIFLKYIFKGALFCIFNVLYTQVKLYTEILPKEIIVGKHARQEFRHFLILSHITVTYP